MESKTKITQGRVSFTQSLFLFLVMTKLISRKLLAMLQFSMIKREGTSFQISAKLKN